MAARSLLGRKRHKSNAENTAAEALSSVPAHVAIIMDGNNRWAKKNLIPGAGGHRAGAEAIRKVLRVCERQKISVLTLFAFSSENWLRPEKEVADLMNLLESYLEKETAEMHKQGIRLRFIGRRDRLRESIVNKMRQAEALTQNNTARDLILAIDYGGQWDITQASIELAKEVARGQITTDDITEQRLAEKMSLAQLPAPDLCIRTGGEHRISNFLLWQFAYSEFYFVDCFWPDFGEVQMLEAIKDYSARQRRFGKTSEQVQATSD
jgi:undecaprenyl diphosphate synthase